MPTIALSGHDWRRIIAALRARNEPSMREHATVIEARLEEHAPGEPVVALPLREEVSLHPVTWARLDGRNWGYRCGRAPCRLPRGCQHKRRWRPH
jgi:hypothetical protein